MAASASDPATIVQRQLDAYNAHDVEGLVATYADGAELFAHPAELLNQGSAQIRERYTRRFRDAQPHAVILQRVVLGPTVIDHEEITTQSAAGPQTVRAVVIYEVSHGKIARAWFISDRKT
jgi:hypothetical protein